MEKDLQGEFEISEAMLGASGRALNVHSFTQGISPFEESAGVDEWQTSRVPISVRLS